MRGLLLIILIASMAAYVQAQACEGTLQVHFFYSPTCPHCAREKPLLERIDSECEVIDVSFYEAGENQDKWEEFSKQYNTTMGGVPITFIADKAFIGYSEESGPLEKDPVSNAYIGYRNQILDAMEESVPGCDMEKLLDGRPQKRINPLWAFLPLLLYPLTWLFFKRKLKAKEKRRLWYAGFAAAGIICLFAFIALTPDTLIKSIAVQLPFPLFVFIVALADGFNPCAFTVLIILLSLLTYTKRKRDMFIVGTAFIITSAVMYFIFIMTMILAGSWALERYGQVILLGLGIAITIAGIINLKDFFFFRKGPSLSITDKQKSKIMQKASKIANSLKEGSANTRILLFAVGSTVLLAVFVNIVELGCTAILPTVYMASLINSYSSEIGLLHIAWTGFYSLVYIIPLFAILLNFIYTFKSARLTEGQGRVLKLVAGLFMLLFGMIMILNPGMLMFG